MTENRKPVEVDWQDIDDAPDLSEAPWRERLDAATVRRGRPHSTAPKISTTIRLDAEVLERFKSSGPGWQSRMNAALREWLDSTKAD